MLIAALVLAATATTPPACLRPVPIDRSVTEHRRPPTWLEIDLCALSHDLEADVDAQRERAERAEADVKRRRTKLSARTSSVVAAQVRPEVLAASSPPASDDTWPIVAAAEGVAVVALAIVVGLLASR